MRLILIPDPTFVESNAIKLSPQPFIGGIMRTYVELHRDTVVNTVKKVIREKTHYRITSASLIQRQKKHMYVTNVENPIKLSLHTRITTKGIV